MTWFWVIGGLTLTTAAIKAAGPIALGGRELPGWFNAMIGLMAPALLAALVATSAFADDDEWAVGAHTVGVAVAGLLLWKGVSVIVGVIVAAVVTALLRHL